MSGDARLRPSERCTVVFAAPALQWCLGAWGPLLPGPLVDRIKAAQAEAAVFIGNFPTRASPRAALHHVNLTPFDDIIELASVDLYDRMLRSAGSPLAKCGEEDLFKGLRTISLAGSHTPLRGWKAIGYAEFCSRDLTAADYPRHDPVEATPPWEKTGVAEVLPRVEGHSRKNLPALLEALREIMEEQTATATTVAYTDGAAGRKHTAGGYYLDRNAPELQMESRRAFHAGLYSTSYQAESAALQALLVDLVDALGGLTATMHGKLVVCSDSQSLLRRLSKGDANQTTRVGRAIWDSIRALRNYGWEVTLQWVPGHSDDKTENPSQQDIVRGNVKADEIAGDQADAFANTEEGLSGKMLQRGAVTSQVRQDAKKRLVDKLGSLIYGRNTGGRRLDVRGLTRAGERVVVGLACGQHLLLNPWVEKSRDGPARPAPVSQDCPHCGRKRTSEHLLLECPVTGAPDYDEKVGEVGTAIRAILSSPRSLFERLIMAEDLRGKLSDFVREQD
eukprot:TRINITY_DN3216_c1_g1_i4.p1 TRINITY_DN3216_c1_g1~~TRINITY_DN3216_c1_g1_i4.p1  ORF type:complete len:506 (+),score=-10.18 TRINITY_DN3216_c1_g1_i4:1052-2569(+)